MTITHDAIRRWAATVPPHSTYWIDDALWMGIWDVLEADAKGAWGAEPGYRYPLITIRPMYEDVKLGRKSALAAYRLLRYPTL